MLLALAIGLWLVPMLAQAAASETGHLRAYREMQEVDPDVARALLKSRQIERECHMLAERIRDIDDEMEREEALHGFPPPPMYRFHGRAMELLEIERAFRKHSAVVLSGMGGVGKTVLAAALARDQRGRAHHVHGVPGQRLARVRGEGHHGRGAEDHPGHRPDRRSVLRLPGSAGSGK